MKYSKQREIILNYIKGSFEHPNASMVYDYTRSLLPNISLGTVYRNLNQLCELGLIRKVIAPDNSVRYDKIENPHSHVYCTKCNNIYDVTSKQFDVISDAVLKETGHKINSDYTVFVGICDNCLKGKGEI